MLSEYQIREKRKLLVKKRREFICNPYQKRLKEGSAKWYRNAFELEKVRGEIKMIDHILRGKKLDYKPLKSQKQLLTIKQQMKMIRPLVRAVLRSDMDARDDDRLLYIRVWELQGSKSAMSLRNFEGKLILGKFATPETISRTRRDLQSKYISLQGKLYDERHLASKQFRNQYEFNFD